MGGGDPSDHVRVCVIAVKRALEALTFSATPTFARPLIENVFSAKIELNQRGFWSNPAKCKTLPGCRSWCKARTIMQLLQKICRRERNLARGIL